MFVSVRVGGGERLISWRNLKMPAFRFHVEGKHFENGVFRKLRHDNRDFPDRVFFKHKFKIAVLLLRL